jgi:hypothetical protein
MHQTKELIIECSELPCSIIIVGVGNANFDAMDELDADDGLLRTVNRVAKRDIVQFVPYVDAIKKGLLTEQVLAEMPG